LAASVFGSGDTALAIDLDDVVFSSIPGDGEAPGKATDQDSGTKYLNFGKEKTGLIVTPAAGSSIIQSLRLTSGNDEPPRDPLTYTLYGTNDPITSGNHSLGDQEAWSLISSGSTGLDTDPGRQAFGAIQDFANSAAFTSYKLVFPMVRDAGAANSMQVADVSLFTAAGGGGSQILATGDFAIAIGEQTGSVSSYPGNEAPPNALDGDSGTKYLNFANRNSGLIVSRADGRPTVVTGLTFTTANDAPGRDPLVFDLYGTNDSVTSADNSLGDQENWSLVGSGSTGLEDFFDMGDGNERRGETGAAQPVANSTAYRAYRLVFPTLRGGEGEGIMQVADVLFDGTVVPEPTALGLLLLGLVGQGFRRKR
jgi:hypothetical protein